MLTRCFALIGTALALIVFAAVFTFDQSQLDISYLHPAYSNFLEFNSKPQVHAHWAMVLSIVLIGMSVVWVNFPASLMQRLRPVCRRFVRTLERFYPFILSCLFFLSLSDRFSTGRDKWILCFGLTMLILILPRYVRVLREHGNRIFVVLAVASLGLATALTFWHPAFFPTWSVAVEAHVGCILTPMNQFTAGLTFGEEIYAVYGILLPAVLGMLQKITGWWTLGEQITLLYVMDLLFLVLCIAAWRMWNSRHIVYLVAGFILVFPFLFSYEHIVTLNHSSLRFFNFSLVPFAILAVRNFRCQSLILGALSGIAFALNIETSLALSCGILSYALAIHPPRSVLKILLSLLIWLLSVCATLLLVAWILYGDIGPFLQSCTYLFAFSSGFAGLPLEFHIVFFVVSTHAIYTVFRCFFIWRKGPLSQKQRFRFFVATTLLIWMAYQMGRYAEGHTETFYPMYAFLLIDAIDVRRVRLFWSSSLRRTSFRASFLLCAALIVIIPAGGRQTLSAIDSYKHANSRQDMVNFDGIEISRDTADQLQSQINYLVEAKDDDILLLTGFSYTIPLKARHYPDNSFTNLYMEGVLASTYREKLQEIFTNQPKLIYFDAAMGKRHNGEKEFYEQVRKDISSHYAPLKIDSGWEIWKLRSAPSTQ